MPNGIMSRRVFYSGRVQGVGFRYTAASIAKTHELKGWVRNLDDGRVELRVEGPSKDVEDCLQAIRDSWAVRRNIQDEQILLEEAEGFSGFEIRIERI